MARSPWLRTLTLAVITMLAGCENGSGPSDPPPTSLSVDVGNDFFRSATNTSTDPAVDTLAVNGTVTWTWTMAGDHAVAFDDPGLPIGEVMSAAGSQHTVIFPAAGSFNYSCPVHGLQMTGTVVVR